MNPIVDAHLDLAWNALGWNRDLTLSVEEIRAAEAGMTDSPARGRGTVSLATMREGGVRVCVGTLLVRVMPEVRPVEGYRRKELDVGTAEMASAVARGQLEYYRELERGGGIRIVTSASQLQEAFGEESGAALRSAPACGVILSMEGADPIVEPSDVQRWFGDGLRAIGLAHYGPGRYAMGTGGIGPLTPRGVELLGEMERLGIILDLTHCAEPGFYQALEKFGGRVLASHNNCRALVAGDRQFSDEQIRMLVERDAVIGVALDSWMLCRAGWVRGQTPREAVRLGDVVDHVDHICQIAGNAKHVGIGSDLDGGFGTEQTPVEIDTIADLQKLEGVLKGRGYGDEEVAGVFYGNWVRFFSEALPA